MMPTSEVISRRATGIWRFRGTDQDQNVEKESLAIKQPTTASEPALNYDHVDGSFEFGGIRVRLVTYRSIPGVIQINASKTISEWNTLRTLNISILSALMIATQVSAIGYLPMPVTTRMIPKDGVSYVSRNPHYLSLLQQR